MKFFRSARVALFACMMLVVFLAFPQRVLAGATLSFTGTNGAYLGHSSALGFEIINTGNATFTGSVTGTITMPAGYGTVDSVGPGCTLSGLAVTCTYTGITLPQGARQGSLFAYYTATSYNGGSISASLSASDNGGPTVSGSHAFPVYDAVLSVGATAPTYALSGSSGSYSITYTNTGGGPTSATPALNSIATTAWTYSGYSGTGWTCSYSFISLNCTYSSALASGASAQPLTLNGTWAASGTARLYATPYDSQAYTTAHISSNTTTLGSIALSSSVATTPTVGSSSATLSLTNSGTIPTITASSVSFQIAAGAIVPSGASGPLSCTLAATTTCTYPAGLSNGTTLQETFSYAVPVADWNTSLAFATSTAGGGGSDVGSVNSFGVASSNLSIAASGNASPTAGTTFDDVLSVSNLSSGTMASATGLTIQSALPTGVTFSSVVSGTGWSCSGTTSILCTYSSSLVQGSTANTLTLALNAQTGLSMGTNISRTYSVTGSDDRHASAPSSTFTSAIGGLNPGNPAYALVPTSATLGGTTSVTVYFQPLNTATDTVTLTYPVPSGLTYTGGSTCTGTTTLTCTSTQNFVHGNSYGFLLNFHVNAAAYPAFSLGTATISAFSGGGSVTSSTSIPVYAANLSATSASSATQPNPGTSFSDTITVANNAGATASATGVTVTASVPSGVSYTSHSGAGWTCTGTTSLTCSNSSSIAAGATSVLTLSYTVNGTPSSAINRAYNVTSTDDRTSPHTTTINDTIGGVSVSLPSFSAVPSSATVGSTTSFAIGYTAANAGSGTVTLTYAVPAGLTFSGATGWSCTGSSTLTCSQTQTFSSGGSYGGTLSFNVGTAAYPSIAVGSANITAQAGGGVSASGASISVNAPQLVLTVTPGTLTSGSNGTVSYTLRNGGTGATSAAPVISIGGAPTGTSFVSAAGTGWTCVSLTCTYGSSLAAGVSANALVATFAVTAYGNTVLTFTVSATDAFAPASSGTQSANATVQGTPSLQSALVHTSTPFVRATTGAYTLTLTNNGTQTTAGNIALASTLPTGMSSLTGSGTSWSCAVPATSCTFSGALAPGQSTTLSLVASIAANAPASLQLSQSITGGGASASAATDTVSVISEIASQAIAAPSAAHVADAITVTPSFTFKGATGLTNAQLSYAIPHGLNYTGVSDASWSCSGSSTLTCTRASALTNGASYTISLNFTVAGSAAPSVDYGTATLTLSGSDTATTADPGLLLVSGSSLVPTVSASALTTTLNGTYSIGVQNAGTVATSGASVVTDTLPVGVSYVSFTGTNWSCAAVAQVVTCSYSSAIAAGASASALMLTVGVSAAAHTVLVNSITATNANDAHASPPIASVTTTVAGIGVLTVSSTHSTLNVGGSGSYTLVVGNNGSAPTAGVLTLIDTLPNGVTFTSAAGGWSCSPSSQIVTCTSSAAIANGATSTITLNVSAALAALGTANNSVTLSGGGATATASTTDSTTVVASSLAIAQTLSAPLVLGQSASYTVNVSNQATATAATSGTTTVVETVTGSQTITAASGNGWTCTVAGATSTCTSTSAIAPGAAYNALTFAVASSGSTGGATAVATVSNPGDSHATPPSASVSGAVTSVVLSAHLAHTGSFSASSAGAYTASISNTGTAPSSGAMQLAVTLPSTLKYTSASGNGWTCSTSTGSPVCAYANVVPAGAATSPLIINVAISPDAVPSVATTVVASGGGALSSSSASDTAQVSGQATFTAPGGGILKLAINGSSSISAISGSTVTFSVTFQNNGNATANNVTISDTLPAGLIPVQALLQSMSRQQQARSQIAGQIEQLTIPALPPGQPFTALFTANVQLAPGATVSNFATISAAGMTPVSTSSVTLFSGSSNVIFDESSGKPIAGASVKLIDQATGAAILPAGVAVPPNAANVNPFTTGSDGRFGFGLSQPQYAGVTYELQVSANGYETRFLQASFTDAGAGTYNVTLAAQDGRALAAAGSFNLVSGPVTISNVLGVLDNIPLFPATGIYASMRADRSLVSFGDRVGLDLEINAEQNAAFSTTRIVATLPPGLVYAPGTAQINGVRVDPQVTGRVLVWSLPSLAGGTRTSVTWISVASADAAPGSTLTPSAAIAAQSLVSSLVGTASATTNISAIAGPLTDRITITGRVVVDDGRGDWLHASRGVAGVRIYAENGMSVVTDAQGRFTLPDMRPGMHALRLDTTTLPAGVHAFATHSYDDPRSTERLVHGVRDTSLMQDVIFVVQGENP